MADIETVAVINRLLTQIGFERFTISVNNRAVLTELLRHLDLADKTVEVLRALDKLAKIGRDRVATEMCESASISLAQADRVLKLAELDGDAESVLERLPEVTGGSDDACAAIARLKDVYQGALSAGVPASKLKVDVSIARGLDYYTGVIFETTLDDLPSIGSVCSGGRYDNLAGLYTKQHLPGIGASLGLDRLLAAMEKLEMLPDITTPAEVFIAFFETQRRDDYLTLSAKLRDAGIACEMFPDAKKLGAQLKYADAHGFRVAIIAGGKEWDSNEVQVKTLATKQSEQVSYSHDAPDVLVTHLSQILAAGL